MRKSNHPSITLAQVKRDTVNGHFILREDPDVITKAEASRRWGVTKGVVSGYPAKGMPVRDDGLLNWVQVDRWRTENITRAKTRSYGVEVKGQRVSVYGLGRSTISLSDDHWRKLLGMEGEIREALKLNIQAGRCTIFGPLSK